MGAEGIPLGKYQTLSILALNNAAFVFLYKPKPVWPNNLFVRIKILLVVQTHKSEHLVWKIVDSGQIHSDYVCLLESLPLHC